MGSKLVLLLVCISFFMALMITSEVAGREVAETSTTPVDESKPAETTEGVEESKHYGGGYGGYGGWGGSGGYGGWGGRGGGYGGWGGRGGGYGGWGGRGGGYGGGGGWGGAQANEP